jgi:hypothetical protein
MRQLDVSTCFFFFFSLLVSTCPSFVLLGREHIMLIILQLHKYPLTAGASCALNLHIYHYAKPHRN